MKIIGDVHYFKVTAYTNICSHANVSIESRVKSLFTTIFKQNTNNDMVVNLFKHSTSAPSSPVQKLAQSPYSEPIKSVKASSATDTHPPLCSDTLRMSLESRNISYRNSKRKQSIDEWVNSSFSIPLDSKTSSNATIKKRTNTPSPIRIEIGDTTKSYYVGHYYATCDDYLMKSSVRRYFKVNCVTEDDSKLFQLDPIVSSVVTIVEEESFLIDITRILTNRMVRLLVVMYVSSAVLITVFVGNAFQSLSL